MWQHEPIDRHYRKRLAASTVASLVVHALLAALLFSILASSSQEGATENVSGGEIVTVERRTPIQVARQPSATQAVAPLPHAPRIAPVRHASLAQPQTQRLPQNRHELARQSPTAPPNPRPIPQQRPQPNPQPTQNIFEVNPRAQLPAAPVSVPTVAPVAVAVKVPSTAPPSPLPSALPSARPSPRAPAPSAPPTTKPPTPAPAAPSAAPTAAAVAVRASAVPNATPAPAARASAPPAANPGVPSPSPTQAAAVARTPGTAASPGPKSQGSPGPRQGAGAQTRPQPPRPVEIQPTPKPSPRARPAPTRSPGIDINARLRAMLPHNPVNPTSKQYSGSYTLQGRLEPTPPPEVLAQTKYLYDVRGVGNEARVKMWVTAARKAGPTTICTGWLVRYPEQPAGNYAPVPANDNIAPANGTQIAIGGGHGHGPASPFASGLAPIVEGIVSLACDGRRLVPFAASASPSP